MNPTEAREHRQYLVNLLLSEGQGRQTLIMTALKYLAEGRLVSEERLEPLLMLLEEFGSAVSGVDEVNHGEKPRYLLPSQHLQRLRDCAITILLNEQQTADAEPQTAAAPSEEDFSSLHELDPLDRALFGLIVRRYNDPLFRDFFDAICGREVTLYTACAAVLDTTKSEVFRRLQPRAKLCTMGLLEHVGEGGFCLDDVCRIKANEFTLAP